ncbi:hypothetical protein H5411_19255, partial [Amycolatopsis echigonensis]|nr:hypothetical protein [Amycolatopsis echigonensis]
EPAVDQRAAGAEERHAAGRTSALSPGHAHDVDDLRGLLAMLGLEAGARV